jgi:hypothetical protein
LLGFALLGAAALRAPVAPEVRAVLAIFVLGMAIDVVSGQNAVEARGWHLIDLGPEDGVRQRMLRLARVAATALSLVTLLSRDQTAWGRLGLVIGTVGMPAVLTAACFVHRDLKYLLPVPALAMTGAVLLALRQARRTAPLLEQRGWLLVLLSMSVGLLIGLYAFDGPLPTPEFVGRYNDFVRRLVRLGHAYAILFGLLAILLARQGAGRLAAGLFLTGNGVSLLAIVLLALRELPTAILAPGPALIALALLLGVRWGVPSGKNARDISPATEPEKERGPTPEREGGS